MMQAGLRREIAHLETQILGEIQVAREAGDARPVNEIPHVASLFRRRNARIAKLDR
jgi:hypothetical protein